MNLLSQLTIVLTLSHFAVSLWLSLLDEVKDVFFSELDEFYQEFGQPVNTSDVRFYLYTSDDDESTDNLIDTTNPAKLSQAKDKVYFLIHGWLGGRESCPWYRPLTKILLEKSPHAFVIQVDWSEPASQFYGHAVFSTESVGKIVGDFIHELVKNYNISSENIVCIGHSLGGQILGWTGKRYSEISKSKLSRIIALDPAQPIFGKRKDDRKLNKNDAQVVMVVHTDEKFNGYRGKCGTIDFFPNGGSNQPGCPSGYDDLIQMCSHTRAYYLFMSALQYPQYFLGKKCANYYEFQNNNCENVEVSLGDLETSQTGDFYLVTGDKPPFFNQTTIKANSRVRKTIYAGKKEVREKGEFLYPKTPYEELGL